ncbi:Uncharacterised protein [Klebsiella pneumoniae]|nr:Uncharacterised protein [Klebsiella pneumoniae]
MATVSFHHPRQDSAGHMQQPFDVGVHHHIPFCRIAFINGFHTQRQSGVIDQNINFTQGFRQ